MSFCDSANSRAIDSAVVNATFTSPEEGINDSSLTSDLSGEDVEADAEAELDGDERANGRRSTKPSISTNKEITVLGKPSDRPRKFQTIPDPARPNTPIAANSGPINLRRNFFMWLF